MDICKTCGKESKFGKYSENKEGKKEFECTSCSQKVYWEMKAMMSGEKQSAGQIIKERFREKLTLLYKLKKFFGLVKEA